MGVRIQHKMARELSAICGLHESVIGGFWQDLVDLVPGWAGGEQQVDDLVMSLYELAEASGLRWPTVVPAVDWAQKGSTLTLNCSVEQAVDLLDLFVQVRTGHWSIVAEVARDANTGDLKSSVKRSLGALRRQIDTTGAEGDPVVKGAIECQQALHGMHLVSMT